ncbi:tetratricopeptide repeat protein [Flavobacterium sp.]|uniref:tetratricopeptide repeat protein n=1 Tax=Flavobacterium sp. TaxID=239 RepID=UPI003753680D
MKTKFQIVIIILVSVIFFINCNNKKLIKNELTEQKHSNCDFFLNKYSDKFMSGENDSALIYINKAIECNPNEFNYKDNKLIFLIATQSYIKAIEQLDELNSSNDDPAYKFQRGILMLKINDINAIKKLEQSYSEFNQISKLTSSNLFYKIALDNYFKGKEYSLNEVAKFKAIYKGKAYENQNIIALENLIKNENKENVLYKLFNITD